MLWKHCHRGSAGGIRREEWSVGRKDPKVNTLVFNNSSELGWRSTWWTQCFDLFFSSLCGDGVAFQNEFSPAGNLGWEWEIRDTAYVIS